MRQAKEVRNLAWGLDRTMPTASRSAVDRFVRKQAMDARVLDLGCGRGPYAALFANRVGCDIEPSPAVHVVADAEALPFGPGVFDMVLSTEMLEHVRNPERAVAEMGRVLRPGGRLVLTTRFLYPIHSEPNDYFRFTRYGLLYLFRGWQVERLSEDLDGSRAAFQLIEFCMNPWPRFARWPAKFALRAVRAVAAAWTGRHGIGGKCPAVASGYCLVAKKALGA